MVVFQGTHLRVISTVWEIVRRIYQSEEADAQERSRVTGYVMHVYEIL